jgi:hypothetical protein
VPARSHHSQPADVSDQHPPATSGRGALRFDWRKAVSFRLFAGSVILALLAGAVASLAWQPLGVLVAVVVFAVVWGNGVLNPEHVLYCASCRKRVKAGADVCHHCGARVR